MKILRNISIESRLERSAVTVGSFDGVHLGHRAVINALIEKAKKREIPSVVVTFEPHPRRFIFDKGMKFLTPESEKVIYLSALGINFLCIIEFDENMAEMSAEKFVEKYLITYLGAVEIIVGSDHNFGKDRAGDARFLNALSQKYNFQLTVVEPVFQDNRPIKSGRIREAVSKGFVSEVSKMLGRPYAIWGEVVQGKGRGSRLGFPTVNINPPDEKLLPPNGVYIAMDENGSPGLLYIGTSPTFDSDRFSIEFHQLEPKKYELGFEIKVSIINRIRDEMKFESKEKLIEMIENDRNILVKSLENVSLTESKKINIYQGG